MLLNLLFPLSDTFGPFNLFQYLTFRSGGALMTSLIIAFLIGPSLIGWLKDRQG
ncbi:MAG: phospho-N-acetylmuramoyl-pentapeptide-transferase, partial [Pseudomonadota bacterium]